MIKNLGSKIQDCRFRIEDLDQGPKFRIADLGLRIMIKDSGLLIQDLSVWKTMA